MKIKQQTDTKDCGLSIIHFFIKYLFYKEQKINKIKEFAFYNQQGISLKNLENLGTHFGLILDSFHCDLTTLMELKFRSPIVILLQNESFNHYVVLEKIKNDIFFIQDPIKGKIKLTKQEFEKKFLNIVVSVSKNPSFSFVNQDKEWWNSLFYFLNNKNNWVILFIIFVSAILNFLSIFYLKTIVDKILPYKQIDLLHKIVLFFVWIFIWKFIQDIIKQIYIKKLQIQKERFLFDKFLIALNKGVNKQIYKLETADYLKRINFIPTFASFSSHFYFNIFNELVTFLLSFFILLWISWQLFLMILAVSILFLVISYFFKKIISKKVPLLYETNIESINSINDFVFSLNNLKNNDLYKMLKNKFDNSYFSFKNKEFSIWQLQFSLSQLQNFFLVITPIFLVYITSFWIIDDSLSLGTLLIFISFFSFFINPLNSISEMLAVYPAISKEIEAINFILNVEKEKYGDYTQEIKGIKLKKINCDLIVNKKLFSVKNLEINNNLILTGKNGVGKSTLLKILNLDQEYSGNFLVNDLDLAFYNKEFLRQRIIYLKNENYFPKTDVFSYITYGEKEKVKTFLENIQNFNLLPLLEKWDIKLDDILINNAKNFSSGQKQIINCLQLLTKQFDLILLDETFENISEQNFQILKKIIKEFQNKAIFIEVSHSKKYLFSDSKVVNVENI
ncbi:Mbov_0121 family peptidase domain-containing ABC transporter [Mycoplasma sp. 1654_15]|uniref:Mbov_0121 family peptidase domain-containing ABC transporter n=1 Tax=Mycoplasma sp. 1654_15 TaxID=2725994 RepID=UPI001449C3FC|nr:cysteine peptidase family C39 domain-containing protein [Mycoplasma sp. 1654_15]QJB71286.1 ATP-binding cassette domain-containing protein [Mycoplasma sp. 1654_15]